MKRKPNILAAFLALVLALLLTACGWGGGDTVERFAQAAPGSGGNIAIPGYEKLSFAAGKTAQSVNLTNPKGNACLFRLSLVLEDGETLWTSDYLKPGKSVTKLTLSRALDAGEYPVTLKYECFTLQDKQPLNGAEIQLTIEVR